MSSGTQIYPDMTSASLPSNGIVPFVVPDTSTGLDPSLNYRVDLGAKFGLYLTAAQLAANTGAAAIGADGDITVQIALTATATDTLSEIQGGKPVPYGTQLVTVSGIAATGDYGAGMPLIYDAAVNSAYVAANSTTSFLDADDNGFRFAQQPWTGTLGRSIPSSAFSWTPITVTGFGPRGLSYSEDPVACAYRTETNDGQYAAGPWIAPYGDDNIGDGSLAAPWQTAGKALTASTDTNIHALPNRDGSAADYDVFSLRSDTNAAGCAKLRAIIAHGPINFRRPCDDISLDTFASGTVGISGGADMEDGDEVVIGGVAITFKDTPTGPLDIPIIMGEGRTQWSQRLTSCINANTTTLGVNASYSGLVAGLTSTLIKANDPGAGGNSITLTVSSVNTILQASGATFAGGGDGWTDEGDGVWSYQTTSAYDAPRAVLNYAVRDPYTGLPVPLAYYANVRRIAFSGQPSAGDYFENTSGLSGATRRLTFVASGTNSFNTGTGQGTVVIGASLADTLDDFAGLINTYSIFFGLVTDSDGTDVRLAARLNSNPTISATVSGATMSLGAQTSGAEELATFALVASENIPFASFSAGGWAFNESTDVLTVKLAGSLDVQANKSTLELIVGTASTARCFVFGGRIALLGDIQFKGTCLVETQAADPVTFPTRAWGTFTNPPERPVGFITPMDAGLLENTGTQAVLQGAFGYCTTSDAFHLTTVGTAAKTQVIECGADYSGDPFTFPVLDFPNKNGISPHGSDCSTVIFSSVFSRNLGPNIVGEGAIWMVDAEGNQSMGLGGNQYGLLGFAGATYYVDSSSFANNLTADASFAAGTNYTFKIGYRTTDGTPKAFIPPSPAV